MSERCNKCGSTKFGIIRDMTSRRQCSCGNTWECPDGEPFPPIKTLTLIFPYGVSTGTCNKIVEAAQKASLCGVSEGGMTPESKYGIYAENCQFSKDSMLYIFGHPKPTPPERKD